MVTKHFHNDALDGLCTDEQLNLLDAIDTLRSQGISHYISLPQIIVCGDQSSGKSSVLEAISGVSFPIKSNLCTRFPTELVLRKHSQSGVRVSIVPHHSRNEAERESLGCFCEALDGFEGLPMLIEKAKAAMGISTHGKAFANDLLRVEISGPDRPHLTIVDLPGLIHSETKQQSAADVQLVQEVVRSYMQEPRSIILAVVSAKNDVANQIVLRLARELDHLGNRTLGVITKPDILVAGSATEAMFVSLAKNQDVEFRLGWHVLKNMDSEKGTPDLQVRNAEESEFFERGIWGDMPRSLVGVASLRVRLSKLLLSQIASELPSLIDEIKVKRETCHKQLQRLGQPRTTPEEQRSYLIQISQSFQSLVRAGVDGTYNDAFFDIRSERGESQRLRAVIQNLNEAFTEHISARGHRRHLSEAHDHQTPSGRQIVVTRQDYIRHIEGLLKRTRGRELPGTFNPMIVKDLFLEQSTPWELLTRDHVGAAWASAKAFLKLVADHVADEVTASALNSVLIAPALDRLREVLDQRTTKLLLPHQKGHPITYNHYFTETLQDIRKGRQRDNISQIIQQFFEVNDIDERYHTGRSINLRDLVNSLLGSRETDMTRFASDEALDCMLAYYKVCTICGRCFAELANRD